MKILIISNYDGEYDFTYEVIEDNIVVEKSKNKRGLTKFGLYNEEWNWFDKKFINPNNNTIQEFDSIIVCEDGEIETYFKGTNY